MLINPKLSSYKQGGKNVKYVEYVETFLTHISKISESKSFLIKCTISVISISRYSDAGKTTSNIHRVLH